MILLISTWNYFCSRRSWWGLFQIINPTDSRKDHMSPWTLMPVVSIAILIIRGRFLSRKNQMPPWGWPHNREGFVLLKISNILLKDIMLCLLIIFMIYNCFFLWIFVSTCAWSVAWPTSLETRASWTTPSRSTSCIRSLFWLAFRIPLAWESWAASRFKVCLMAIFGQDLVMSFFWPGFDLLWSSQFSKWVFPKSGLNPIWLFSRWRSLRRWARFCLGVFCQESDICNEAKNMFRFTSIYKEGRLGQGKREA